MVYATICPFFPTRLLTHEKRANGAYTCSLDELEILTDKWIYFIENAENLEVIPKNIDDKGLLAAYKDANKHTWS